MRENNSDLHKTCLRDSIRRSDPHHRRRACVNAADTCALHAHRVDSKADKHQLDYQPILQLLQGLCRLPREIRERTRGALQCIRVEFCIIASLTPFGQLKET